ncbi:MAG: energy transducer TonB [Saprospiraceae bacterium]|nr:energy transducer TonB [Saprospiraceae bacterium]
MAFFIKITMFIHFLYLNWNSSNCECLFVNQSPNFKMGQDSLICFINQNMRNPYEAIDIEGTVYLNFLVELDGSISNIKVVRGVGSGWNQEAERILLLTSGNWQPACRNSKCIKDSITIGIKCKIQ